MSEIDREFATCIASEHSVYLRHPATGLFVRNRADIGVILEQQTCWGSLLREPPSPGLLLDLGGYIGDSVWWFLSNNLASTAFSLEPLPSNADVFRANWDSDSRVLLLRAAAMAKPDGPVNLHLGRQYLASSSVEPYRGREAIAVPTVAWDWLLALKPAIIKCDVEGAEQEYNWRLLPDSVKVVAMEMHQFRPKWIESGRCIDESLLSLGFHHLRAPRHEPLFRKFQSAVWVR